MGARGTSYRISTPRSNYNNNSIAVTAQALFKLKEMISFVQLRWFCFKKARGRVFHVATSNNTAGHHVVDYFLKAVGYTAETCQSFTVLPDDNSTLSLNCDEWGGNETHTAVDRLGSYFNRGRLRMYRNVSSWFDEKKYFSVKSPRFLCCDDAPANGVSPGDTWEVYAR